MAETIVDKHIVSDDSSWGYHDMMLERHRILDGARGLGGPVVFLADKEAADAADAEGEATSQGELQITQN